MPTLKQACDFFSDQLTFDKAHVYLTARRLQEADLLPKREGRKGGADITGDHVATLLLGVMATDNCVVTVSVVRKYAKYISFIKDGLLREQIRIDGLFVVKESFHKLGQTDDAEGVFFSKNHREMIGSCRDYVTFSYLPPVLVNHLKSFLISGKNG